MAPTLLEQLCDEWIRAREACFERWCQIADGGRPRWSDLVASQQPLHDVSEQLRQQCSADIAAAAALREKLLRAHVDGEGQAASAVAGVRMKTARDVIRAEWASERVHLMYSREALSVGLGWPHRGELVTVTAGSCVSGGRELMVGGTGVYLNSYHVCNVSHQVWLLDLSAKDRRKGTVLVRWLPLTPAGRADPGGDIGMRVKGGTWPNLAVPLPNHPQVDDIPATALAVGGRPNGRSAVHPGAPPARAAALGDGARTAAAAGQLALAFDEWEPQKGGDARPGVTGRGRGTTRGGLGPGPSAQRTPGSAQAPAGARHLPTTRDGFSR